MPSSGIPQMRPLYKPYEDAFNQNDAAAVAALYTEDAVLLPPETDPVYGREAIEKGWAVKRGYARENPALRVERRALPLTEITTLPNATVQALFGYARDREPALLLYLTLAAFAGVRVER